MSIYPMINISIKFLKNKIYKNMDLTDEQFVELVYKMVSPGILIK